MATVPSDGPVSAYPTLSAPALICFSEGNDVVGLPLKGVIVVTFVSDCAIAAPDEASSAAAIVIAAFRKNRPRGCIVATVCERAMMFSYSQMTAFTNSMRVRSLHHTLPC